MKEDTIKKILIVFSIFFCLIFIFLLITIKVNKQLDDTTSTYDRCIVYIGNDKIEFTLKSWRKYGDNQIQIISKDETRYLVSTDNIIFIKEK